MKSCSDFAPVSQLSGVPFYSDQAGSKPDQQRVSANLARLSNVRDFMACLEKPLDGRASPEELASAYGALDKWAQAAAILMAPADTEARVERVFMAAGFAIIALKFRAKGIAISPQVSTWLSRLAAAVRGDYAKSYGNVYAWAGAGSALTALVSGDKEAYAFQDQVWAKEIGKIKPDGTIDTELSRAGRALVYHQLTASGLMLLHRSRLALGINDDPAKLAGLKRLNDRVGQALCNPTSLQAAAHAKQEVPGSWGFRVALALRDETMPQTWLTCGPHQPDFFALDYGGDMRVAAQALDASSVQR